MHLSELVFKKKPIYYFLMLCIIAGGILAYKALSKLEDPEIVLMQAKIITVYPGASAHEVELQVTKVLENELSSLSDIQKIYSRSTANVSEINVELTMMVPQEEIQQRWEFMRRKIDRALPLLPSGVQKPLVIDDMGDVYGMFYAMSSSDFSLADMSAYADLIKREMLNVQGVSRVQLFGTQEPCIDITLNIEKAGKLGIMPVQILAALQDKTRTNYAGNVEIGERQVRVKIDNQIKSVSDIESLEIKGLDGKVFHLGDIAKVEETYPEPMRNTLHLNNKNAVSISISMESGENIIEVGKRVEARMAEIMHEIPAGIEFEKVFFQPDKVNDSINGFMLNLISSVLIVILVLMLTTGLRSGIIIGNGLLLTILATFPLLLIAGGSMQRISLGAFIVAMGMLVDNAIVVLDGILVDLQKGRRNKKVFVNPAKRTAMPLLGATLIAVTAFLPVFISKDTAGVYARDLFIVLCFSLLISWILALTQIPVSASKFLKVKQSRINKDPYDAKFFRVLRRSLAFLMNYRGATIGISALALAIAAYNIKNVKQTFFPDFNYNQVYIEYKLPNGTLPEKVNEDLKKITGDFLSHSEVKMVVSSQGMSPTRYSLVRAMSEMSDSYGELIVNFEDYNTMIRMKPVLEDYLHENYPDAYTRIRKYNLSIKSTHAVEAQFSGPDPAVLKSLSRQAEDIMRNCPYTDKRTICNDWEPMSQSLNIELNNSVTALNGTMRSDVSNTILTATDGLPVGAFYRGEHKIPINLKIRDNDGKRIADISTIPVWNMIPNISALNEETIQGLMTGTETQESIRDKMLDPTPLNALSDNIKLDWEEPVVWRSNGKRTIQAQCDPKDDFGPAMVRQNIKDSIESIALPDGYTLEWMGEYELQHTALKNIFSYLPIAVMLIILILILLFNDIKRPLIVILTIPMAIVGIVAGLILFRMPFTFIAIIGSMGLMGMLIKNAIVLLDEIAQQQKEGKGAYLAILDSVIVRARPVIMASATTILGMLPLFFDPMYKSMAAAVISGLLVGTLITLIFIPVLYAVFYGVKTPKPASIEAQNEIHF